MKRAFTCVLPVIVLLLILTACDDTYTAEQIDGVEIPQEMSVMKNIYSLYLILSVVIPVAMIVCHKLVA